MLIPLWKWKIKIQNTACLSYTPTRKDFLNLFYKQIWSFHYSMATERPSKQFIWLIVTSVLYSLPLSSRNALFREGPKSRVLGQSVNGRKCNLRPDRSHAAIILLQLRQPLSTDTYLSKTDARRPRARIAKFNLLLLELLPSFCLSVVCEWLKTH